MSRTETREAEDALFRMRRGERLGYAMIGSVIAAGLVATWVTSRWLSFGYVHDSGIPEAGYYFIDFNSGLVTLCHGHHPSLSRGSYWYCDEEWCEGTLHWGPIVEVDVEPLHKTATVALWVPFVLIAIPTAFLWRPLRQRPPPYCCQRCGYDLTGNVSGACPECGTPREQA